MSRINTAFKKMDRVNFVPEDLQDQAQFDTPLPIGFGQTISQPTTVALMLEWLGPSKGDKILDVGSGSGWTTALLSELVGNTGHIYAVERIPKLVEMGKQNCKKLDITNVSFYKATKKYGLPKYAPYDRILVSAAARTLPGELLDQLKTNGKLIIPVRTDILEISKLPRIYKMRRHPGFSFVPLETALPISVEDN